MKNFNKWWEEHKGKLTNGGIVNSHEVMTVKHMCKMAFLHGSIIEIQRAKHNMDLVTGEK